MSQFLKISKQEFQMSLMKVQVLCVILECEFSPWLEYSPSKDAAFCLPCFLFDKPTGNAGSHASIDVVKVLAFQGLAFRGRDESSDSINCGNFLEILDLVVSYNEYVAEAIEKAPKNASYKSPKIQKEILHVFSNKVKKVIREEIDDAKFCLIVDEACDESMKEQMAIVIKFVHKDGFVRERFFGCQSQDILNLMNFVSSTKALIQKFRDEEWDILLTIVKSFCEARDIDVSNMNARYVERGGLACYQQDEFTIEHHYREDIFYVAIDSILQELNHRFSKPAVELLNLSLALDPKEALSTTTTKRAFSAMNIIKNRLRNKMEDDFLMDSMILYIEKEIAAKFGTESIINNFRDLKER
ncbi:uncharacterized protein LOC115985089 [Quercus lobata]|uniref:uncharacterized protein LOC115985089 n=1 Tax=Quercus lobata TaxID=97700 RepID=UPI0012477558|nr:uncharacterized protein LOC115985089 [Quercus lobata]